MIAAFRAFARAVRHLNGNGYVYVWANIAFIVFSLPIITIPAAWAGLCRLSYYAIRQPNAEWSDFITGFKEMLVRGAFMALLNAVVLFINLTNLLNVPGDSVAVWGLRTFWFVVLILWLMVQFYAYPLYYAMEKPTLSGAFRNAAVMLVTNPFFTIGLLIGLLILWSLSTVLFALWVLLTISAMAIIANVAVQDRLRRAGFDLPPADVPPEISDEVFYGGQR